jgi:hypothetical protein
MGADGLGPVASRGDQAGGLVAVGDAQSAPRLVEMPVDGVLGQAQAASDLLGAEMLVHQLQAITFAGRQSINAAY